MTQIWMYGILGNIGDIDILKVMLQSTGCVKLKKSFKKSIEGKDKSNLSQEISTQHNGRWR